MKHATITFLLLLAAFLLCISCRHRKSPEEGELFLQASHKAFLTNADSLPSSRLSLFTAEQEYDFTPSQLIHLKQLQLRLYGSYNNELAQKLITETDKLARESGSDSLLCAVRWDIFRVYQMQNDTTAALQVLRQQTPLVRKLYGEEELISYYYALSLMYSYQNCPEQHLYWTQKARPTLERRLYSWYNMICEANLKAGDYRAAILYADSALTGKSGSELGNSAAAEVKGEALIRLFRNDEALRWYASAVQNIDSFRQKRDVRSYSLNQEKVIYQYASLLHSTGQPREAINQLEKIISRPTSGRIIRNIEDTRDRPVATARLMASCYRTLNRQDDFQRYTHLADSLQFALNKMRLETSNKKTGEELQNQLLKKQIEQQLNDMTEARNSQYILAGVVCVLLLVILTGIRAWRQRQKRIRELFDLLAGRHARWLEKHYEPQFLPLHEEPVVDTETVQTAEDAAVQANYHRLYLRILHVMQKEKPFLDPGLDLVTLSRSVGTNRTMLSTVLNRETGMSFSNWLAEYRVNYLIEQLPLHPDKSASELYPLAGFSSRTSFFRQFRQVTGMTPNQYLAQAKS